MIGPSRWLVFAAVLFFGVGPACAATDKNDL
jgi:hypothetical protein